MSIYNQVNKPVLRRPVEPGLAPSVRVVHETGLRSTSSDRHAERVDDQLRTEIVAHRPTDHFAAPGVDHAGEEEIALPGRDVLDVRDLESVRPRGSEITPHQVGRRGRFLARDRRPEALLAAPRDAGNPALAHQ